MTKKQTKKSVRKKPAPPSSALVRRKNEAPPRRSVSVESLIPVVERRLDSEESGKAFEALVASFSPGTVGAAKLVSAADAIEDEDLLLDLARRGFFEAVRSLTLRRLILDEEENAPILVEAANNQAAVGWSSLDDRYPGAWVLADFGEAIAVNGTLLSDDDKIPERPKDMTLTDRGGRVTDSEEVIRPETIVDAIVARIEAPVGARVAVLEVLQEEVPHGTAVVVSGNIEIWMDEATARAAAELGFDASYADDE